MYILIDSLKFINIFSFLNVFIVNLLHQRAHVLSQNTDVSDREEKAFSFCFSNDIIEDISRNVLISILKLPCLHPLGIRSYFL